MARPKIKVRPCALALLWLGAAIGCSDPTSNGEVAQAEDGSLPEGETVKEPMTGEQLLAQPPEGWQQGFATKTPSLRLVEFLPAENSAEDWVEKVTFESLSGDPLPDPIDFVTGIAADQSDTCERFEHFNIQSGLENNYPTSVRLLACSHNELTEKGQVTLIKAIQANDHFYVITRSKRVPPIAEGAQPISEAEMATWAAYMRAITVCDTNSAQHPCGAPAEGSSASEEPPT